MIKKNLTQCSIKCIIFDWDGTLIDDLSALKKAYFCFLKKFGKNGSEEEFDRYLNGLTIPQVVGFLKEKYKLYESSEKLLKRYEDKITKIIKDSEVFESAQQVLEELKKRGVSIGLATSSKKEYMWEKFTKLGWEVYFDFYVFGDEVEKAKPNPDIYLLALKRAGFKKFQTLAVEDSTNGILAAKDAGIFSIGIAKDFKYKKKLYENGACIVISDLSELPILIKNV